MQPVGRQRVVSAAKHAPYVLGVVARRIEIGVIAHLRRQVHRHTFDRKQRAGKQRGVVAQIECLRSQQPLQALARRRPHLATGGHKRVQRRLVEAARRQQPRLLHRRQVQHEVADTHCTARPLLIRRAEHTVGQVLQRKVRLSRHLNKRSHHFHSSTNLPIHQSTNLPIYQFTITCPASSPAASRQRPPCLPAGPGWQRAYRKGIARPSVPRSARSRRPG